MADGLVQETDATGEVFSYRGNGIFLYLGYARSGLPEAAQRYLARIEREQEPEWAITGLRYFNVYGPNQRYDAYGNVIPIFVFGSR